jgi:hypothetical protein
MPSQLITPPDLVLTNQSLLLLNILDSELANIVDWLKTTPVEYNIHLYHNEMTDHADWVIDLAKRIPIMIVSEKFKQFVPEAMKDVMLERGTNCIYFGPGTNYTEPVDVLIHINQNN